ncbi:MAG TPA: BON domain-containing protein [Pirellulales bacterium]|nr:BON domain-containing protein [Pirellulales bacterium]
MELLGAIRHQLNLSPSVELFSPALHHTLRGEGRNRPVDSTTEKVLSRLRESPYLALRHIKCECHAGVLTLRGRLPTFYTKQVMHALLKDIEGIRRINDCTQVVDHGRSHRRVG